MLAASSHNYGQMGAQASRLMIGRGVGHDIRPQNFCSE